MTTMKHAKKNVPLSHAAGAALLVTAMLAGSAPAWAGQAAIKCEAGKNGAAGAYFSCLAKAEKALVLSGDLARYDAAVAKCQSKQQATWDKLEAAATAAGDPCPSEGDAFDVQDLLDGCSGGVSRGLSGGIAAASPLVCEAELQACDGDLAICAESCGCPPASDGALATGQTTSYGAGSDGAEERGRARSFTDNGDGTITDNVTGLMWEKKSDDGSIHDVDNSYTWGEDPAPQIMNGTIVTTFLADLNSGGGFAGYTDWRIPNLQELESLRNFENTAPTVYPAFNSSCTGGCSVTSCSCTRSNGYWSSTTFRAFPNYAWYVNFNYGHTNDTYKTVDYYAVRAVRAGS